MGKDKDKGQSKQYYEDFLIRRNFLWKRLENGQQKRMLCHLTSLNLSNESADNTAIGSYSLYDEFYSDLWFHLVYLKINPHGSILKNF